MKKTISIVLLILVFFIIYFIQSNFFTWFTIAGIEPNLFAIFVLFIGLFAGKKLGLIVGLLGEYLDKSFSKESRLTIMLMMAGSTIIYEVGCYIFNIITLGVSVEIISFMKILLIEVLYNLIIAIIIYPLIQKMGHALEEVFKSRNILTRYF